MSYSTKKVSKKGKNNKTKALYKKILFLMRQLNTSLPWKPHCWVTLRIAPWKKHRRSLLPQLNHH